MNCVQCGLKFENEEEETCSFHIAQPNRGEYDCCGQREPCVVKQKHASHHHSNYPYSSFWDFARGISGYTDTCELFGSITEENLEDNSVEKAYVGQLLRFKSRGASIADQNLLHIRIGNINKSSKYHFKNYTEQELDAIGAAGETRIFRNTEKTDSYAQADWIIKDQLVAGVRLECKVACFDQPTIKEVLFTQYPLTKGETTVIQNGGIVEKKPTGPYELPAPSSNVKGDVIDLSEVQVREPKEFSNIDQVSGQGDLVLSVERLTANQDRMVDGSDSFEFQMSFLNSGESTFMFTKLKIEYKQLNDDEWKTLGPKDIIWPYESPFPLTFASFQTGKLAGIASVPFFDGTKERPLRNCSYNARHTPMRIRFSMVDVKERTVSRIMEYVQPVRRIEQRNDKDDIFLFVDNPLTCTRIAKHFIAEQRTDRSSLVSNGFSFDTSDARQAVHKANKTGKTEIWLEDKFDNNRNDYSVNYYALVDKTCQAVYAIKIQLVDKDTGIGMQGYLPLRFYGEEDAAESPVTLAKEEASLPETVKEIPPASELFKFDDEGKDDFVPQTASNAANNSGGSGAGGGGGALGSADMSSIEKTLVALNENLARTATALEALVALQLTKK